MIGSVRLNKLPWVISCVLFGTVMVVTALSFAGISGSLEEQKIVERLKPAGEVTVVGGVAKKAETAVTIADVGERRYVETCKMCHETGLAGAPKYGDKADWDMRLKEGMDTLYLHALKGYKAMPPKGGCATCSDDEIKKAVDYMTSHAK